MKRPLFILGFMTACSSVSFATISVVHVSSQTDSCAGPRCTLTINSTTSGNLLVALETCGNSSEASSAPTYNGGVAFTTFTSVNNLGNFNPSGGFRGESAWMGYTIDSTGGHTTVSFVDAAGGDCNVAVYEVNSTNGWPSNPQDQSALNNVGGVAQATFTSGTTATLTQASEIGFGLLFIKAAFTTITADSPWANVFNSGWNGTQICSYATNIVNATTGIAYTGTLSPSEDYGGAIMTFLDNAPAVSNPMPPGLTINGGRWTINGCKVMIQ